jgi:hypothetical protein
LGAAQRWWQRRQLGATLGGDEARNEHLLYGESIFQAAADAGVFSFWGVYLVRLDAAEWLVGLFTALPALVAIVTMLPAGAFVQRRQNLAATAGWARIIYRTVTACFIFLPYLPPGLAAYLMVGTAGLLSIPGPVVDIAITTLWGQAVSPARRPHMLSMRWAINGLFAAGLGYLAGQWLDWAPYPLNYQVIFASGLVVGLGSVYLLGKVKLKPVARPTKPQRLGLRDIVPLIRSQPAFLEFVVASTIFRLGLYLPMAIYTIYRVRTLGSSDAWIGTLLMVQRLVSVGSYLVVARIANRPQFKRNMWFSCMAAALFPLSMALARTPEQLLVSAVMGGVFGSAMNVYMTDRLFDVSPEDQRPAFVAANSLLANIVAFVAPMLGTAISEATTIYVGLYVAAGLRVLGGLVFPLLGRRTQRAERAQQA